MSTTNDYTTVTIPRETKERLDDAKWSLYRTTEVPYRITIEKLIDDHDDV